MSNFHPQNTPLHHLHLHPATHLRHHHHRVINQDNENSALNTTSRLNQKSSLSSKISKPLDDKTNTIKKSKKIVNLTHSPQFEKLKSSQSNHYSTATTNTNSLKKSVKSSINNNSHLSLLSDPSKPLLFRTPLTAKRPQRPPPIEPQSDDEDNQDNCQDDQLEDSFRSLNQFDSLTFNLDKNNVPDVEYGPPTAFVEPVELSDDLCDFSEFFKNLKNPPQGHLPHFYTSDGVTDTISYILSHDGQKSNWSFEPNHPITDYAGDHQLDQIHLPPVLPRAERKTVLKRFSSKASLRTVNPKSTTPTLSNRPFSSTALRTKSRSMTNTTIGSISRPNTRRKELSSLELYSNPEKLVSSHIPTAYQRAIKQLIENEIAGISRELNDYVESCRNENTFTNEVLLDEFNNLNEFQFKI
ncbi:hypothetical protein O181_048067 [Austropuccinia psidii MF-1]|uniref:Uncharacterized protein n=1 Tax=Austropuccinia psidii MF-1 TaxID=1389203 RepID=A0A9Q3DZ44_9BASI|nr:hypothetical protein [Austropuccinia psidii MF-1]